MRADIELTCRISQLLNTVLVQWKDSDGQVINDNTHYFVSQGSKDENGNQDSILRISDTKLQLLGSSSATFSCQVLSEDETAAVTKTMALAIYDFSKYISF